MTAGGLFGACLAVRPPGPEVCRICCGAVEEPFRLCWSCARIEGGLGGELRPLLPLSLTKRGTGLYAALRQYKGRPGSVALRQQARLAELVAAFFERHSACVAPDGFDKVAVVPSMQVPAEPHPLIATLKSVPQLAHKVVDVLHAGSASVDRNVADRAAYHCADSVVDGDRILLVDDIYTTGAHMQSAAAALGDNGARSISLVAVARHQDPSWPPARRLLEWSAAAQRAWTVETCVRCAPS